MKFLLRLFSKTSLWNEILRREGFSFSDKIESGSIWSEVFHRVPILKDWLKRRELILLKSVTLQDKDKQFILGQIAENRMYQKFDIPPPGGIEEAPKVEPKLISRESFLSLWGKKNANTKKPGEAPGGGKGDEEKPSENPG